jgi:hypothetical protein
MNTDDPRYWRIRAEEARESAEQISNLESKHTMLEIAASYEQQAERIEQPLRDSKKSN